jgi:CspA family cold shock protein
MAVSGIVREWYDDEGWGVIDSQDTPGGCWAHVTCVLVLGNPTLRAGQPVTMDCEPAEQDGYAFRAIDVWPAGQVPHRPVREETTGASAGYGSTLTISFDDADPPDST